MNKKRSGKGLRTSIFLLVILISVYLFLHSSIFNITKIDISGNEKVSREEILALSGITPGTKLFAVDKDIVSRAISVHPLVKNVTIQRHIPHTITIKVVERKVWAIVPFQDTLLCIDDEGICIDKQNNLQIYKYPIITLEKMPANINYGQAVMPQAIKMIRQVWQAIPENNRQEISEFHYINEDNTIIIYTIKGTEVKFGNLERIEEKAGNFTQVIKIESDLEKEGKEVLEYVDLRFQGQPVIKTKI